MLSRKTRNSLVALILLASSVNACGQDCFDGIHVIFPLTSEDRNTLKLVTKAFPQRLGLWINCTDLFVYYNKDNFYRFAESIDFTRKVLGVCETDGYYSRVHVLRVDSDESFLWILIHELCHAVGYNHGEAMDKAINSVYMEVLHMMAENG